MIKKIVLLFVVILLAIGAGAFFYLDAIVTRAIEVVGTRVLGTNVTVAAVTISPFNGAGSIADLQIANPEGFAADYVFELGYVAIALNLNSLFTDVIEIESITIAQPVITYETRITTDNVRALLANLPGSEDASVASPAAQGSSKRLIIRQLQILNPQLTLSAAVLSAPIQLPDIILRDIGAEGGAASVAEALRIILTALRTAILQADLPSLELLRDALENAVQDTVDQAGQAVERAVDNLGNRLRQLGN